MKKVYKLQDLDCANCAASKIAGVQKASVNFLTQKMTIEADEGEHQRILAEAKKVIKKVEPDCIVLA